MIIKKYQTKAINSLLDRFKRFVEENRKCKGILKAPTGSGKTFIVSNFLSEFVKRYNNNNYCFIWASPGRKLTDQSREKLTNYHKDKGDLDCIEFADLTENKLTENQILFLNWESINKKDINTIVKEKEGNFYLGKILENTKENNLKVFLIIDESHKNASTEISKNLIHDIFDPDFVLSVSATPPAIEYDFIEPIYPDEVKGEAMIRKSIIINPDHQKTLNKNLISYDNVDSDLNLLNKAIDLRNSLHKSYKKNNINVNPLILVQLPTRNTDKDEKLKNYLISMLKKKGINYENRKLAIHISEDSQNLENIKKLDNETEILFFKVAAATGWDCPRAQILIKFREWKDLSFEIQTVGRIMRVTNPDYGYFKDDLLNYGYVFTNIEPIQLRKEEGENYLSINSSNKKNNLLDFKISSHSVKRHRDKTRLNTQYIKIFYDISKNYKLADKIELKNTSIEKKLIENVVIENIDETHDEISGNVSLDKFSLRNYQYFLDEFISNNMSPFFPEERSVNRIKEALYKFFEKENITSINDFKKIIEIILDKKNYLHFINVISDALKAYKEHTENIEREDITINEWDPPTIDFYSYEFTNLKVKKSVLQPFFYDNKHSTEKTFINFIDNLENVEAWYQNRVNDTKYFSVKYLDELKKIKLFYPDFLIRFKKNVIGIFDTKAGFTLSTKDTKYKLIGLNQYLKNISDAEVKFIGGIVTQNNNQFIYFSGDVRKDEHLNFSNWNKFPLN